MTPVRVAGELRTVLQIVMRHPLTYADHPSPRGTCVGSGPMQGQADASQHPRSGLAPERRMRTTADWCYVRRGVMDCVCGVFVCG